MFYYLIMSETILGVPNALIVGSGFDSLIPLIPFEFKPEGYQPVEVAIGAINGLIAQIRKAKSAAGMAWSWRGYRVGAAGIAFDFERRIYGSFVGANIKPAQDSPMNIHAEQMVIAKARFHKLPSIIALAVWGDPNDTDSNPNGAKTRRPCLRCDHMFIEEPEVSDRTLILSSNQDFTACEFYTVRELHDFYLNNESGQLTDVPIYDLSDSMNDSDYNNRIEIPHLLPKVLRLFPESPQVQMLGLE